MTILIIFYSSTDQQEAIKLFSSSNWHNQIYILKKSPFNFGSSCDFSVCHLRLKAVCQYNHCLHISFQLLCTYCNPVINHNHQELKRGKKKSNCLPLVLSSSFSVSIPLGCFSLPLIVIHLSPSCLGGGSFCNTASGTLSVH